MSRKPKVHCPECGHSAHDTGFDVKPRLFGCNQCGHTFVHKPPKKKRTAAELAVIRAQQNVKRVEREVAHSVKAKMLECDQDECKRALAAWVMAIRVRFEELYESVQKVYFDSRKEDSLLHGLIDSNRLGDIHSALGDIDGDIPMLTLSCEIRDPVKIAQGFKKNWNL